MSTIQMLKGLGLLIGMIIGAGMFAIPHTVWQAGFLWSTFHVVLVIVLVTYTHILYGNVLYTRQEKHRLPGYIREYFGKYQYGTVLAFRFFSYFGTQLAYGVFAGELLSYLIPGVPPYYFTLIFFTVFSIFIYLKISGAGRVNLLLTSALVLFVLGLFLFLLPNLEQPRLPIFSHSGLWFLPYGVFLFAFSGASAVPEVVDMYGRKEKKVFHRAALIATGIVGVVYLLFTLSVLGIAGEGVAEKSLMTLKEYGGEKVFYLGVLIGFLAVATSYIPMGLELAFTFSYDVGLRHFSAWLLAAFVPLLFFLIGANDFVQIISLVGAVGLGVEGISILLLARKVLKTHVAPIVIMTFFLSLGVLFGLADSLGVL